MEWLAHDAVELIVAVHLIKLQRIVLEILQVKCSSLSRLRLHHLLATARTSAAFKTSHFFNLIISLYQYYLGRII